MTNDNSNTATAEMDDGLSVAVFADNDGRINLLQDDAVMNVPQEEVAEFLIKVAATALDAGLDLSKLDNLVDFIIEQGSEA